MAIAPVNRQAINFILGTADDFNEETYVDLKGQEYYNLVQISDPTQFLIRFTGSEDIEIKITTLDGDLLYASIDESAITEYSSYAKIEIDWATFIPSYTGCLRIWVKQSHQTWDQGYKSQAINLQTTHTGTVLLSWQNNEAVFGFDYSNTDFTQYLRVKGRLWHPKFPKDRKDVFVDSAGKRRILYSRTKEEMTLDISEIPDYLHRALSIALEHDEFYVDGVGYINEENDYSPSWRKTSRLAPVEIIVVEDELNLTNAYCFVAGPCDFEIVVDYIVDITESGQEDGKVSIQLQYGQTFTYSLDGVTYQESNLITGLAEGENTIYVKDQFNCVKSETITVEIMDQIGTIKMFGGTISGNFDGTGLGLAGWDGWALCNGSNGTSNLKGKFIVGYDDSDADYDTIGNTGGEAEVLLTAEQSGLPAHDVPYTGSATGTTFDGVKLVANNDSQNFSVDAEDAAEAHENRPPYFTLAFVQRIA
jgi:hypothetical protein